MMQNMSYVRFENTLRALKECYEALAEMESLDELSARERESACRLIKLCEEVGKLRDDFINEPI